MTASAAGVSFRPGELEVRPDGTGNLLGSRCECGAHFFPIREACSNCLNTDMDGDSDADLADFALFQAAFAGQ